MSVFGFSAGAASSRVYPALKPVQMFKAQRIFKEYCNEAGCIIPEKWAQLVADARCGSYVADYKARFGQLQLCWMPHFLGMCRLGTLDVDEVWDALGLKPRNLDEIYACMEEAFGACQGLNKVALEVRLEDETDVIKIAALKLRIAASVLGNELSVVSPRKCSQRALLQATLHLTFVLEVNPASWEAHKWLALAQFMQKALAAALLSARRSLLLNSQQADVWDFGGCVAALAGNRFQANWMLTHGAALKSFKAAMHYGELMAALPDEAAKGFKLALQLAGSPSETQMAQTYLRRVLASHPDCKDVPPLQADEDTCLEPEIQVGGDQAKTLLF